MAWASPSGARRAVRVTTTTVYGPALDEVLSRRLRDVESYLVVRDFGLREHDPVEGCLRLKPPRA